MTSFEVAGIAFVAGLAFGALTGWLAKRRGVEVTMEPLQPLRTEWRKKP